MQAPIDIQPSSTGEASMEYFPGQMPAVRLPVGYQIGMCVVALAMILLPLAYLGFIGLVGWGMWGWATHAGHFFFSDNRGSGRIYGVFIILYSIPLLVGFILILFMLKCFFSRWHVEEFAAPISNLDHPQVFHFLGELCQKMDAPIPSRVDVSLAVNASAGFREGFRSLFGNDIMLTFGLPLAAGLSCREFAAVIAHELGHFTQKSAMRFDFIVQTIHGWLFRAVYDRDDLDDWLEEEDSSGFTVILALVAGMAISFTRGIMWCLLVLGHAITSFMSRQMEFHADACAVAIAGTDAFVALLNKLHILSLASDQAQVLLKNKVQPKRPDDLSSYIAMLAAQCAGQTQGKVLTAVALRKTRWSYSHPSYTERVQRALQANQPGMIQNDQPATILFGDFPTLSRALTLAGYQLAGQPISPETLFRVEATAPEIVPDTSVQEREIRAYFCGLGLFLRPILIGSDHRLTIGLASAKAEQLVQTRATLQSTDLIVFREAVKQLDGTLLQLLEWNALVQAGIAIDPKEFPLLEPDITDLAAEIESVEMRRKKLGQEMEPFEEAARLRLKTALGLLRSPAASRLLPNSEQLQDEAHDLLHVFGKLGTAFPQLLELRKEFASLQVLLRVRGQNCSGLLKSALADCAARSNQLLKEIHSVFGSAGYPFEHPKGNISVVDYARAKDYDADPARMAQLEITSHLQMLLALYHRILGRLISIALQVEAALDQPTSTSGAARS